MSASWVYIQIWEGYLRDYICLSQVTRVFDIYWQGADGRDCKQ